MSNQSVKVVLSALLIAGFLASFNINSTMWLQAAILTAVMLLLWRGHQLWIILLTLPRDLSYLWRMWQVIRTNRKMKKANLTPAALLSANAALTPDRPCFIFHKREWSYREVNEYSWRIAHVFSRRGLSHGDVVALMSTNRPEYVATWLGLSRLGVVTALINTNLRHDALKHSLSVATPRVVITSANLCQAVREVREVLGEECQLLRLCGADQVDQETVDEPDFALLDQELRDASSSPIEGLAPPNYRDKLLYIYTSGTTGFPKAAVLLNSRFMFGAIAAKKLLPLYKTDRIYNPLPLYHSSGGVLGVGPAIAFGVTSVLREKFSASEYWKECTELNCTVGQYIGEMCRYMLCAPATNFDQDHKVRVMVGNGLRPAIWKQFVHRFHVPQIVELYAATEGNANIVNVDGTVGAVGFIPRILPESFSPIALVRVDANTGELVRSGPDNLCVRCEPGEPGMFVGIIKEGDPTREYHGYVDRQASKKNIARNVLSMGDKVFVSGDVMVMDEKGYLFFKDRTGDTFRWKGENVATAEVEAAVSNAVGLRDVCVYGVEVPHCEGKAGMATILDVDDSLDILALGRSLALTLPTYAMPLFLRIAKKLEMTGTYKLKKKDLVKQGYNPTEVKDKLYYKSGKNSEYKELNLDVYDEIMLGHLRL